MSDGRTIGNLYDREKFDEAIENAATAYLQSVMGEYAQSEGGERTRPTIVKNIYSMLEDLSVEYYQTLDKYLDGEPVTKFAEYTAESVEPDYAQGKTDKGLIELVMACRLGGWKVKEPERAKAYYEGKFPERETEKKADVLKNTPPTLSPEEAIEQAKAKYEAKLAKEKQGEKERKAVSKENGKAYKAYLKGLKKQDREAYAKLTALHKLERAEQKKLLKLHNRVVKNAAKFGYLNELAQLDPDKRAFSETEKKTFAKLRSEEKRLVQEQDEYRQSLRALNKQRLALGAITNGQYELRESQLTSFDFTYRVIRDNPQQASAENEARAGEREATIRKEPVRERIELQAEEKTQTAERKERETERTEKLAESDELSV